MSDVEIINMVVNSNAVDNGNDSNEEAASPYLLLMQHNLSRKLSSFANLSKATTCIKSRFFINWRSEIGMTGGVP